MASRLVRVTATGNVDGTNPGYLKSVHLEGGTAVSDCDVRLDGSGGTIVLSLACALEEADDWRSADPDGVYYEGPLHATLAGAGASASFEIER